MRLKYTVNEYDAGRKVYGILKGELRLSDTQIKRLKNGGGIFLDGQPSFTTRRVQQGQTVEVNLSVSEQPPQFPPENGELNILWESEGLLAVNKPAGILSHPSRARFTGTLANYVAGYLLDRYSDASCHLVNRLDRDTSGVVLVARSAHLQRLCAQAIKEPEAYKEYTAYTFGWPEPEDGVIDMPIRREMPQKMRRIVSDDGQRAVTLYKTAGRWELLGGEVSRVEYRLETGRTHQIRVHSLAAGFPLLGDGLYFSDRSKALSERLGLTSQLLHAGRLSFVNPATGERVDIAAPVVREDMRSLEEKLMKIGKVSIDI